MDHSDSFQITFRQLSRGKIAISAHQPTEEFRVVPGMEHDESHAFGHALLNLVDQSVTDILMGNMPPPQKYIGIVEELFA
jgi:hypothetical protein